MSFLERIKNHFRGEPAPSRNVRQALVDGYNAFDAGREHYETRNTEEALECFDRAIEHGFKDGSLFLMRGTCLHELGWHLDAIVDYDEAISLDLQDSNLYFMRALSKSAMGDHEGCLVDFSKAIEFSKTDNQLNQTYNAGAREMGWDNVTAIYEAQALMATVTSDDTWERKRERAQSKGWRGGHGQL